MAVSISPTSSRQLTSSYHTARGRVFSCFCSVLFPALSPLSTTNSSYTYRVLSRSLYCLMRIIHRTFTFHHRFISLHCTASHLTSSLHPTHMCVSYAHVSGVYIFCFCLCLCLSLSLCLCLCICFVSRLPFHQFFFSLFF